MVEARTVAALSTPARSNPIDTSTELGRVFCDLQMACRTGDIEVVDTLLSTPNLDINQTDEWDYSPLILASLCGHTAIVELLLSRGAVCDRDTFQGERCIYGALNDTIRDILLSFDISKKVDVSQPFASHISSFLNPINRMVQKDIGFKFDHVNGASNRDLRLMGLNRFLLAARSDYFKDKVTPGGLWYSESIVSMSSTTDAFVFKVIVDYIYLRTDSLPLDNKTIVDSLRQLAAEIGANDLARAIDVVSECKDDKQRAKLKHDHSYKFVEKAREDMSKFLMEKIIDNRVSVKLELDEEVEIEDIDPKQYLDNLHKLQLIQSDGIPDIIMSTVDIPSDSIIYYPVHKSMLMRSEYFATMFESDIFKASIKEVPCVIEEGKSIIDKPNIDDTHVPIVQMSNNCSNSEVAELVLTFLYHDDIKYIPPGLIIELLFAADELLLDRLKTMCAVSITSSFNKFTWDEYQELLPRLGYSSFDLIRVSWQTRCDKLEQHVSKMIAHNLKTIYEDKQQCEQLEELIAESASKIQQRQNTDTIELVDDIRYYLSKKYGVHDEFSDFVPIGVFRDDSEVPEDVKIRQQGMLVYERDVEMIDLLLDKLELDA